jgi:hypothetical protein
MTRSLTVFPAPTESGYQLAQRVLRVAAEFGYQGRMEDEYSLRTGNRACYCDDLVVYDLTVTEGQVGAYRALVPAYTWLDHVLIVSRTPIPMNLLPVRPGGAPPYPYPMTRLPDGSPVRFPAFTIFGESRGEWIAEDDHSLLDWLRRQLHDLQRHPAGPRLPREPSFRPLWPASREVRRFTEEMSKRHYAARLRDEAFVSYRSRVYDDVLRLATAVAKAPVPGSERRSLRIVSPSEFALERELLSAGSRWMVLSFLRLLIRASQELWVYRTDDYLASWWTLAELIVAGALQEDPQGLAPQVKVFNPDRQALADDETGLRIGLGREDRSVIQSLLLVTTPGISSPPFGGIGGESRVPQLPRKGGGAGGWGPFWGDLLIERQALTNANEPYQPTARAFFGALDDMLQVDVRDVASAAAGDGTVRARDGTRLRVKEILPRLLFARASATHPERPVLRKLPTYYALI